VLAIEVLRIRAFWHIQQNFANESWLSRIEEKAIRHSFSYGSPEYSVFRTLSNS
jgi:hypothetical protein